MIKWINKKRNKKGFTLIELIVVIAILGILAALAIPRLSGSRNAANRSAVRANLRTIESALNIGEAEGKDFSTVTDSASTSVLKDLDLLNAEVVGPGDATYLISVATEESKTTYRAQVKFADNKTFDFKLKPVGEAAAADASSDVAYTLDQLAED